MMRIPAAALLSALVAGPAAADWAFRPPEASDDLGSAQVRNAQGQLMDIGCGNGGSVDIQLRSNLNSLRREQEFTFAFPGMRGMYAAPFTCQAGVCSSHYQYANGQPWTLKQRTNLMDAFKREPQVTVYGQTDRHGPIATFTLKGSSAALGRLRQGAGLCDGL